MSVGIGVCVLAMYVCGVYVVCVWGRCVCVCMWYVVCFLCVMCVFVCGLCVCGFCVFV